MPASNTHYFASHSDLQAYITAAALSEEKSYFLRNRTLCRTIAGNVCDLLTITNFDRSVRQHVAPSQYVPLSNLVCC